MPPFPCTKICELPHDYPCLSPWPETIDRYPEVMHGQHAIRRWEYAMTLATIAAWQDRVIPNDPLQILDVGGAGSGFWRVLTGITSEDILVVDPAFTDRDDDPGQRRGVAQSLEAYAATAAHDRWDVITCVSVIEHIPDLRPFFRAAHMLLKPGGLLVGTTDCAETLPDVYHFHWMRSRIYTPTTLRKFLTGLRELGYMSFGSTDLTYHGPQVYDYSMASFALTKRALGEL